MAYRRNRERYGRKTTLFGLRERGREGSRRGRKKTMQNPQIDIEKTKQIRINSELHRLLKIKAATEKVSIKTLVEHTMSELVDYTLK